MKVLTQDITGYASRIPYGRKGDAVSVIEDKGDMILVEREGVRFHVKPEMIEERAEDTTKQATKAIEQVEQVAKGWPEPEPLPTYIPKKKQSRRTNGKPPGVQPSQTNLF